MHAWLKMQLGRMSGRSQLAEAIRYGAVTTVRLHATQAPAEPLAGGRLCGRLRYRVIGEPDAVNCCHCRDCQLLTGSAFAVNAIFHTARVELLGSQWSMRDVVTASDGGRSWRCFDCGVLLFADHPKFGDALRFVRVGTLDDATRLTPDAHYFVRSKHPWVVIPEGVPAWETLPPVPHAQPETEAG